MLKKSLSFLLSFCLVVSLFPSLIYAERESFSLNISNPTHWGDLIELATYFVNILLWVAITGVVFAVLYAGFLFIFSRGEPEKVKKGGKALLLTFVGLMIILFSKAIIAIIKNVLGS